MYDEPLAISPHQPSDLPGDPSHSTPYTAAISCTDCSGEEGGVPTVEGVSLASCFFCRETKGTWSCTWNLVGTWILSPQWPWAGQMGIRTYASSGHVVGSLGVLNHLISSWSDGQQSAFLFLSFTPGLFMLNILCALYVPEMVNSMEMGGVKSSGLKGRQPEEALSIENLGIIIRS